MLVCALTVCGCRPSGAQIAATWKPAIPGAKAAALTAADGTKVVGELLKAEKQPPVGVILLFHQARSNSAEYAPIAPRLAKLGYDCLAVNLRAGGDMFGASNPTAALAPGPKGYMDAYADMEAALKWATDGKYRTVVAWGSSYSASLALKLAADHPEVSGVLAFSPGEYMPQKGVVQSWNARVKVPTLFACTPDEAKAEVVRIYKAAPPVPERSADLLLAMAKSVHGSSTMSPDKNPGGAEGYWKFVQAFLSRFGSPRADLKR